MRRKSGTRVLGPYHDTERDQWRVVIIEPPEEGEDEGPRASRCFASQEEAHEHIREIEEELKLEGPITVKEALDLYEERLKTRGNTKKPKPNRPGSVASTMRRLRGLLGEGARRLVAVRAGERYQAYAADHAADTHQNALGQAVTFGKWCVARGLLRSNPWAAVEPFGERTKGKEQLRVNEARTLIAKCVELDDEPAVAVMCGLLLGFGASEIVERVGRDVDDGGRILWMPKGKTTNRTRRVKVPLLPEELGFEAEWLRRKLVELADAAGSVGYLWRAESARSKKGHRDRNWVLENCKRICRLAGVPEITSHGLRGTHATLGADEGVMPEAVASAIGNTPQVARDHYIAPGAVESGRAKRALTVLAGGRK